MIAIHSPGALHLPRVTARWWRPIVLGVLWGVAVSAMESVVLPVYPDAWTGFWKILAWIVPGWCVVGVGLATLIEWVGARFERTSQIVTFMIACALGLSAIYSMLYSLAPASGPRSGMSVVFPQGFDPLVALVYQFWVVLFYGGLYFVAWSLRHRSQRSRETLARVEIARIKAETMLAEEQLHRLRGRIEPQLLLRVVTEVERRYLSDGPSADELLGLLVAFLRLAMPAIRSGKSGLGAELSLVEAYDALGANLERRSRQWYRFPIFHFRRCSCCRSSTRSHPAPDNPSSAKSVSATNRTQSSSGLSGDRSGTTTGSRRGSNIGCAWRYRPCTAWRGGCVITRPRP